MKTVKDVQETFKASIETQINGDKNHGWGQKDSLNVVADLLAEFGGSFASVEENDVAIAKAVLEHIDGVINPSACRQRLESAKLLDKSEGRGAKAKSVFAAFNA